MMDVVLQVGKIQLSKWSSDFCHTSKGWAVDSSDGDTFGMSCTMGEAEARTLFWDVVNFVTANPATGEFWCNGK